MKTDCVNISSHSYAWQEGKVESPAGIIPLVSTILTFKDRIGSDCCSQSQSCCQEDSSKTITMEEKMSDTNEKKKNKEKEQTSECGSGCSCNTESPGKSRWLVGVIIILIAGILIVRAVIKENNSKTQESNTEFALPQSSTGTDEQMPAGPAVQAPEDKTSAVKVNATSNAAAGQAEDKPLVCGEMIVSLKELNSKAMDKDGVFIFLAGQDAAKNRMAAEAVKKGAATLRGRNVSMGVFTLKKGSKEYTNLIRQIPPPGVLTMVKGRGASTVTDDVTESKLIQAFVAASSAGGCGSGGCCGPSGCN